MPSLEPSVKAQELPENFKAIDVKVISCPCCGYGRVLVPVEAVRVAD
jgi:hypothetical protein